MDRLIRAVALVDLDDTLFQTSRKCPPEVPGHSLTPLGFATDGSALSFATPRQMSFLCWLSETAHLIPVTARSLDALRRVRIPYGTAICAHGGIILDHLGDIDEDWASHISSQASVHASTMNAFSEAIAERARRDDIAIQVRVLREGETPLYVLAKHADADAEALHRVVDAAIGDLPSDWTSHRNGNNVALLPPHLGKRQAVERILPTLRSTFPDVPIVGVGDSRTDAGFMSLGDYAMMPVGSQLGMSILDETPHADR